MPKNFGPSPTGFERRTTQSPIPGWGTAVPHCCPTCQARRRQGKNNFQNVLLQQFETSNLYSIFPSSPQKMTPKWCQVHSNVAWVERGLRDFSKRCVSACRGNLVLKWNSQKDAWWLYYIILYHIILYHIKLYNTIILYYSILLYNYIILYYIVLYIYNILYCIIL